MRHRSPSFPAVRSLWLHGGVALAATGLAVLLWLSFGALVAPSPFPLLLVAVMVSAWYGGLWPGLLATAAGGLIIDYFFESPPHELALSSPQTLAQLVGFALLALLASSLQVNLRDTRRRAEVAQQRLRDLVHDAGAIVWEQHPETFQFTFVTQPAEELLGYPVARWTTEPDFWATLLHPDDRAQAQALCREAVRDDRDYELEYRAMAADGRLVWLRHIGHVVREDTSQVRQLRGVIVDITERKRTEEALRESELKFRWVAQSAADAIISCDSRGGIISWNTGAWRLFGYSEAEMLGESLTRVMPERYRDCHQRGLARLRAAGAPRVLGQTLELAGLRRDGTEFPLELSLARWTARGEWFYTGILRDITERKCAEQAREHAYRQLELERGRLEEVLRQLPAGVIIAEAPSGRIVLCNEQVDRILGRTYQPSSGIDQYGQRQLFAADNQLVRPQDTPLARALLTGEVIIGEEFAVERGDGSRGTIRVSAAPVHDRERRIIAGVATLYDVTQQKRAAAAEHFLVEAGHQLAGSLDYEATLAKVARLALPSLATWCAVDLVGPDEVLRQVAITHVDPARDEVLREFRRRSPFDPDLPYGVAKVVQTGRSELVTDVTAWSTAIGIAPEHATMVSDLEVHSYMIVPLLARGRAIGAISLVRSEPGAAYTSEDLVLAEELASRCALAIDNARLYRHSEQAVRVRDEFLAAASHELRTPLAHIKGFVSTLRQTDVEWDESTRQDFLSEVEQEADRLGKLIGDLLDITRIESGGLEPSARAWTSPGMLVAGGVDRARGLLGDRPICVEAPADLPRVRVDASQLERVVANLVENAAKFSPPGRPLRIVAAQVEGAVELRVEDDGPGIPTEDLERIFEKFFRVRSDRARVPGTGLGLAICRRLVEAHGGRIRAENRPAGGARFIVSLPVSGAVRGEAG